MTYPQTGEFYECEESLPVAEITDARVRTCWRRPDEFMPAGVQAQVGKQVQEMFQDPQKLANMQIAMQNLLKAKTAGGGAGNNQNLMAGEMIWVHGYQ